MNTFVIESIISSGAYGMVICGLHKLDNRKYAIKIIPVEPSSIKDKTNEMALVKTTTIKDLHKYYDDIEPSNYNDVIAEIQLLANMNHPNIIRYFGSWITNMNGKTYCCIQMEYMNYTLSEYISKINNTDKIKVIKSLVDGIKYLHQNNVIHNDLKPENILLKVIDGKIEEICVADFGTSSHQYNHHIGKDYGGTYPYVRNDEKVSFSKDIYSLGIICIQIIYNIFTYSHLIDTLTNINNKDINVYLKQCIDVEPINRPDIELFHNLLSMNINFT